METISALDKKEFRNQVEPRLVLGRWGPLGFIGRSGFALYFSLGAADKRLVGFGIFGFA